MSDPTPAAPPPAARGPSPLQLGIVVAIIASGIVLTALTADVKQVSEPGIQLVDNRPFLPATAGRWTGGEQTGLTPEERAVLPSDTEGVRRVYTNQDGRMIYCSIVLAGADVTSIHRPELCLTGQGWKLQKLRTEQVPRPGNKLTVSRLDASSTLPTKNGQTTQAFSVFVYWFVGKERTTPHHWQRIWWTTVDRVLYNRNHRWAYFLISNIAPADSPGANPDAAQNASMELISQFVQDIDTQLTPH